MIFLRNILLLAVRHCINSIAKLLRHPFRFEFVFIKILEKNYAPESMFTFIQVGANDGISHDHLYHFVKSRNSCGLVIEPLKDYFDLLKKNYAFNPNIIAINKAVHKSKKKLSLYRLNPKMAHLVPLWAGGIASVFPDHHKRTQIPSDYIIPEEVPADSLMNILKNYHCKKTDLIQIDVEGYDLEVLEMIDFKKVKPKIIRLEYISLSLEDVLKAKKILTKEGFFCFFQGADLVGIKLFELKL